jgi:4-amino-4-deoxychorismate lyase
MCQLIETIQIKNGAVQLLPYHQARMNASYYEKWGCSNIHNLTAIISVPQHALNGIWKCRIVYSKTTVSVEYSQYSYRKIQSLRFVFDDTIDYHLKFEDRTHLQLLLQQKSDADEILIVKHGVVTDTSFSNIAFFDGLNWYTPSDYLLAGTKRSYLLDTKQILEKKIYYENVKIFEKARLINCFYDLSAGIDIPISEIT